MALDEGRRARLREHRSGLVTTFRDELRNPLLAVLGYTDVLLGEERRGGERDALEAIRIHGEKLLALVEGMTPPQSPSAPVAPDSAPEEVTLRDLVSGVTGSRAGAIEAHGLRSWTDLRPELGQRVRVDGGQVRRALELLLDASLRLTPKGWIGVRGSFRTPGQVCIEVLDSGPAMTCEEFQQLSCRALTRDATAGIGLASAREIARGLGGDIEFEPSAHGGSIYRLRLPVWPAAEAVRTAAPGILSSGPRACRRVLVVDNRTEARHCLRRELEQLGLDVAVTGSGRSSIDAALSSHFDLVLLARGLPHMDGASAVRALRRAGFEGPVIAICDEFPFEERKELEVLGFDGLLVRPIDRIGLIETVARHLPPAERPFAAACA